MIDKKLTDSKIVKALEEQINDKMCEYQRYEAACGVWCSLKGIPCCDMSGKRRIDNCKEYLPVPYIVIAKATLDLVNRLQAENERLKNAYKQVVWERDIFAEDMKQEIKKDCSYLMLDIKTIKAEAYKECIEKIEQRDVSESDFYIMVKKTEFDNLLKELVGEDNASKN